MPPSPAPKPPEPYVTAERRAELLSLLSTHAEPEFQRFLDSNLVTPSHTCGELRELLLAHAEVAALRTRLRALEEALPGLRREHSITCHLGLALGDGCCCPAAAHNARLDALARGEGE